MRLGLFSQMELMSQVLAVLLQWVECLRNRNPANFYCYETLVLYLKQCQVVFYIDNEAARAAFIQGVGFTPLAKRLTYWYDELEVRLGDITWFGRGAPHSNLADGPSRMGFNDPLLSEAKRIRFMLPKHVSDLGLATGAAET